MDTTTRTGMMAKISTWGGRGTGRELSGETLRVRVTDIRSGLDAALAQIERRTRQHAASVSPQGTELRHGQPFENHYQITLGRPVSRRLGGGTSVTGSIWIGVPVGTGLGSVGFRG